MPDLTAFPTQATTEKVDNIRLQQQAPQLTAQDWARDIRMSAAVNKTTVGVETDRVTPDLLLATSKKLLAISRKEAQSDPKDSLEFQRFYGPAEYFAEHVLRDSNKLGRDLLWKATNKGNLDFMPVGALEKHISDVFYNSKLAQMNDDSSPLEAIEGSFKTTRMGEGGIGDIDSAPDEMRTVQPSFFGFIDPARSVDGMRVGLDAYLSKHCMKGSDGKLYGKFIDAKTGKEVLLDSVTAAKSVIAGPEMMKANTKSIFALGGDTGIRIVPKSSVQYYLARPDDAYSISSNLVTMPSGVKEMRLHMGCLHPDTTCFVTDKYNNTSIVKALDIGKTYSSICGCTTDNKACVYPLKNTVAKFLPRKNWFLKIVLKSGRVLITSKDHKWLTVDAAGVHTLVKADKLQKDDLVLRTLFRDAPNRRTFLFNKVVTVATAEFLGICARDLTLSTDGTPRIPVTNDNKQIILDFITRYNYTENDIHMQRVKGIQYAVIKNASLQSWLKYNIGFTSDTRIVPSIILSAHMRIIAAFIDGYTKNKDFVGVDSNEDMWILSIQNNTMRDCIAYLLARLGSDTLYRDSVYKTHTELALKLIEPVTCIEDMVLDKIKSIIAVPDASIMIDIDIDDNLYATANGIITHNSKYPNQAISLVHREAPLVRTLDEASGKDMSTLIGKYMGARFTDKAGTVTAVRKDRIDMTYDDGTKGSIGLYHNFPMNAKGYLDNTATVKAGQHIDKGTCVASSNYTDDKGVAAIGTNLNVGWISWKGGTFEDAVLISEDAAKKLTSTTMYKTAIDLDKSIKLGKSNYNAWKPGEYTKLQLEQLDDDGVVKPGTVLSKGDPLVLAIQTTEPSPGTLGKRLLTDVSETWDHDHNGVVTDVVKTKKGVQIRTTVTAPAEVGDKVAGLHGNKSVISHILPANQMPQTKDGKALDLVFSPYGLISRCYDDRTEFLTKDGWKFGKDVLDSDILMCYNPATKTCEFLPQQDKFHRQEYTGCLVCAKHNDNIVFAVTPKHKVFYSLYDNTDTNYPHIEGRINDIFGQDVLFPTPDSVLRITKDDWLIIDYTGMTYCPTVPTGYIVTRRDGITEICLGNTNPSQLYEALLGKVARKTGKPEVMPVFYDGDLYKHVSDKLKENHLKASEDLINPETGLTIPNVITGVTHVHKLKHLAESKMSARGTSSYSAEGLPAGSGFDKSKRYGPLEIGALVGHNAFASILDAKLIRGQSNADFWRELRTGGIPTMPGEPLVHKKFFAHLTGSGINIRKTPKGISCFALTSSDVDSLAGPRELKTRDTYEAKNFRPLDGGLFGQDIFGINGDQWGYIKLDEPLPNPVMEQPLSRLLRISDKDFEAIVAGSKEVNGMKNAADLKERLRHINLNQEAEQAKKEFKESSKSQKDAALKRYTAIERMRRNGVQPSDYMLDKIPVLPPIYRPISSHAGVTMVADSNYLYAQLLDYRDDMREAKDLPDEYQQQARRNIYRGWKELAGMYDPENTKLESKHVQGLLKWALGEGPKQSAFQRKLIGSTVDTVGRGVITPDSRVKLNELGIPRNMAFNIMAPFVTRELVKRGYTAVDAMKMVKEQTKQAEDVLVQVMETHPVQMNRAPTLHKYNILAFKPRLVNGHAIHINPSIVGNFAADFDGDCISGLVKIALSTQTYNKYFNNFSNLTLDKSETCGILNVNSNTNKENLQMISQETKIDASITTGVFTLDQLPKVGGTEVQRSPTVTEWDLVPGIYVDTIDPVTGTHAYAEMTKVSKHTNLVMYDCQTATLGRYERVITCSEDHSLITLNPWTLEYEKTTPLESLKRCVPKIKYNVTNEPDNCESHTDLGVDKPLGHRLGVFLGIMLGDGWVDSICQSVIACNDESLQEYIKTLFEKGNEVMPVNSTPSLLTYKADPARFSQKDQHKFYLHLTNKASLALRLAIGSGAEAKHIPAESLNASRAHLRGILMGLLATDGSVSYSTGGTSKKASEKSILIHTISTELRDGIQMLCKRLGIRTSATPYKGKHSLSVCYAISLSIDDTAREFKAHPKTCVIPHAKKQEAMEKIIADVVAVKDVDLCMSCKPYPRGLLGEFNFAKVETLEGISYANIVRARERGVIDSNSALKIAAALENFDWTNYKESKSIRKMDRRNHTPEQAKALVDKWIALVRDSNIDWATVDKVTKSDCTVGWDCTVPGPYTFTLFDGTVVQDTVNIHVPVSDQARKEAVDRMFPEHSLMGVRDRKTMSPPQKEYVQGLYIATRMKDPAKTPTKHFRNIQEAKEAQRQGILDVDDPIIIDNN